MLFLHLHKNCWIFSLKHYTLVHKLNNELNNELKNESGVMGVLIYPENDTSYPVAQQPEQAITNNHMDTAQQFLIILYDVSDNVITKNRTGTVALFDRYLYPAHVNMLCSLYTKIITEFTQYAISI